VAEGEGSAVASGNSGFELLVAGIATAPEIAACGLCSGVSTKGKAVEIDMLCGTDGAEVSADRLPSVEEAAVGYAAAGSGIEIGGAVEIGCVAGIGWGCRIGWAGMTIPAAKLASALTAVSGGLGLSFSAASAARKLAASARSFTGPRGPKARMCKP